MQKITFNLDEKNVETLKEVNKKLSNIHSPIKVSRSDTINFCIAYNTLTQPKYKESNKMDT